MKAFGKDDCIGCYIDVDDGTVAFSKNGKFLGDAFTIPSELHGKTFYPAVVLKVTECLPVLLTLHAVDSPHFRGGVVLHVTVDSF